MGKGNMFITATSFSLAICLSLSVSSSLAASNVVESKDSGTLIDSTNEDGTVSFSLGLGAGYMTGESTELVYWPEFNNHKASELTWKIDSLYLTNVNASLSFSSSWFVQFDGWFKLTDGDGTLDDYDWMIIGGDWTDWSHEEADVTKASMIDISAGWRGIDKESFSLSGLVGYKRDVFAWESYGGSYVYSINGFRDSRGNFPDNEPGIGYEQTFTSIYFGLGFDFYINDTITINSRAVYSPLVEAEAVDHHYQRNLVTYDDFSGGNMFGFDIAASFKVTEKLAVNGGYSYLYYDEMQGDSDWYYNDSGIVVTEPDGAGTDHNSSLFTLTLCYSF